MGKTLYARPTDNVISTATISVQSGTPDSGYPAANLANGDPAEPVKITGDGALLVEFAGPVNIKLVALFNHTCSAITIKGSTVKTNWPGAPFSQSFSILTKREDGFSFNPFLSLDQTYQYWLLSLTRENGAVSAVIGESWFCSASRVWPNTGIAPKAVTDEEHPITENITAAKVPLIYDWLTARRIIKAYASYKGTDRADMTSLFRSTHNRVKPFLFIRDSDVSDAMLVRAAVTRTTTRESANLDGENLVLEEVSPGIPL